MYSSTCFLQPKFITPDCYFLQTGLKMMAKTGTKIFCETLESCKISCICENFWQKIIQ